MGDIEGLIDKVNELKLDDNEELMKKLKQGIALLISILWSMIQFVVVVVCLIYESRFIDC